MLKKCRIIFLLIPLQATWCWAAKWKIGYLHDPELPEEVVKKAREENSQGHLYVYTNVLNENLVFFPVLYVSDALQSQLPEGLQTNHPPPSEEAAASSEGTVGGATALSLSRPETGLNPDAPEFTPGFHPKLLRQPKSNSGKQRLLRKGRLGKITDEKIRKIIKYLVEHGYTIISGNFIYSPLRSSASAHRLVNSENASCLLPEDEHWQNDIWYATQIEGDGAGAYWIELTPAIQDHLLQNIDNNNEIHTPQELLQPPTVPPFTSDIATETHHTTTSIAGVQVTPEAINQQTQTGASSTFQNLATQTASIQTRAEPTQTETPKYQATSSQTDDAAQKKKPKSEEQLYHTGTQTITEDIPPDSAEDIQTKASDRSEANNADKLPPPEPEPPAATESEARASEQDQRSPEHATLVTTHSSTETTSLRHPALSGSTSDSKEEKTDPPDNKVNTITDEVKTQPQRPPVTTNFNIVSEHEKKDSTPVRRIAPRLRESEKTCYSVCTSNTRGNNIKVPYSKKNKKNAESHQKNKSKKTTASNPGDQKNEEKPLSKKEIKKKLTSSSSMYNDIRFMVLAMGASSLTVFACIFHALNQLDFSTANVSSHNPGNQPPKVERPTATKKTYSQRPETRELSDAQPTKKAALPLVPEQLEAAFAEDKQMLGLLEELQQTNPFIRTTSLHEPGSSLSRTVTPDDIEVKLKKYSSTKSAQEGSVLFISSLGKEVQYSKIPLKEKERFLKYLHPRLKELYQQARLDFMESFHWLNLLCGYTSKQEIFRLNCLKKATNLLSSPHWLEQSLHQSMYLGYQTGNRQQPLTEWQLAPLWRLESKQSIATPIIIPVISEQGRKRLVLHEKHRSMIDGFDPTILAAYQHIEQISNDLKWIPVSSDNLIRGKKASFKSTVLKITVHNQEQGFLVFEGAKKINPGKMRLRQEATSSFEFCHRLKTQQAIELCYEFNDHFSSQFNLFMEVITTHPDLEIPLYLYLVSASYDTETTDHRWNENFEEHEKKINLHIDQKKPTLLAAHTLKRVDQLKASQLAHIFEAITKIVPDHLVKHSVADLLQLCGYIPNSPTLELCIANHLSELSSPPSFSYKAITRSYLAGLPGFYYDLPTNYCRYLPTIALTHSGNDRHLKMIPSAQIIRKGSPEEIIQELPEDREISASSGDHDIWLGVDPNKEIKSIMVAYINAGGLNEADSTFYYPDDSDRTRVIPERLHPTSTYIIYYENTEQVTVYTFYRGQLLPMAAP